MYPLTLSSVCCLVGPTLSTENPEFSQGMGDCRKNFLPIIPQDVSFWKSAQIMQKHSKLGSLEDQDPKSKISKINFASWIRGFCRHLYTFVSSFFLKDQDPKTESRFSPKIMQIRCKAGSLKDQDPISKISKINFASWIKGFCRHLSHLSFIF